MKKENSSYFYKKGKRQQKQKPLSLLDVPGCSVIQALHPSCGRTTSRQRPFGLVWRKLLCEEEWDREYNQREREGQDKFNLSGMISLYIIGSHKLSWEIYCIWIRSIVLVKVVHIVDGLMCIYFLYLALLRKEIKKGYY